MNQKEKIQDSRALEILESTIRIKLIFISLISTLMLVGYIALLAPEVKALDTSINTIFIVVLAILAVSSLGFYLHQLLSYEQLARSLKREVPEKVAELRLLVAELSAQASHAESVKTDDFHHARIEADRLLTLAKTVIANLRVRESESLSLLESGRPIDLLEIDELIEKPVSLTPQSQNQVSSQEPLPPLKMEEVESWMQDLYLALHKKLGIAKDDQTKARNSASLSRVDVLESIDALDNELSDNSTDDASEYSKRRQLLLDEMKKRK